MAETVAIKPKLSCLYSLLENVKNPSKNGERSLTTGPFKYYHYNCDGFNDVGWGCAYRTLQSICSLVVEQTRMKSSFEDADDPPTLVDIQKTLISLGDKAPSFLHSKEWIGAIEVSYVIDTLYDVSCKILHVPTGSGLVKHAETIQNYFENFGGLIMMGGDQDAASKGIAGIHVSPTSTHLLVVDPHYSGPATTEQKLFELGFVRWENIENFNQSSFYNLCLPLIKCKSK